MPEIEIENLSFTFENRSSPALDIINLKIEKGEFIVLAGPSGSGKSTLIKCINGLIPHRYVGTYDGLVKIGGILLHSQILRIVFQLVMFLFLVSGQRKLICRRF